MKLNCLSPGEGATEVRLLERHGHATAFVLTLALRLVVDRPMVKLSPSHALGMCVVRHQHSCAHRQIIGLATIVATSPPGGEP